MIIKRKFGTIYLDGEPVPPGTEYPGNGQKIEIRDTVPGKEITWILVNGMLVADRNILTFVSWDALNENHLVFGQQMYFSGETWTTRLIKGGRASYHDNKEMDSILQAVQEAPDMLHIRSRDKKHAEYAAPHWGNIQGFYDNQFRMTSWGQELSVNSRKEHSQAICWSAREAISEVREDQWKVTPFRDIVETGVQLSYLGWRPILEFSTVFLRYDRAIGQDIMVQTTDGAMITGILQEATEYDLVMSMAHIASPGGKTIAVSKGHDGFVSIMRDSIKVVRPWRCKEEEISTSFKIVQKDSYISSFPF